MTAAHERQKEEPDELSDRHSVRQTARLALAVVVACGP